MGRSASLGPQRCYAQSRCLECSLMNINTIMCVFVTSAALSMGPRRRVPLALGRKGCRHDHHSVAAQSAAPCLLDTLPSPGLGAGEVVVGRAMIGRR